MIDKKTICIVSPCYNESSNVEELYARVSEIWRRYPQYNFNYLFIDNASQDDTVEKLRMLSKNDSRVKVIVNTRNFGHIRSPYYGIIQSEGDATIYLASDLQDPPELIPGFIEEWERGYKVVLATKPTSSIGGLMHTIRKSYYRFLDAISEVPLTKDTTGFGLYDKVVLDEVRKINDPYPYLRGIICEIGFEIKTIVFSQPPRLRGISKNNFYTLYDIGILGIISHSLIPIRLAIFFWIYVGSIIFTLCNRLFYCKTNMVGFISNGYSSNHYCDVWDVWHITNVYWHIG
jgi:glycosyltransferase involved in cell wall biosynthesis